MIGASIQQKGSNVSDFVNRLNSSLKKSILVSVGISLQLITITKPGMTRILHACTLPLVQFHVSAVKTCLWHGPYTFVDQFDSVNYQIKLLGIHQLFGTVASNIASELPNLLLSIILSFHRHLATHFHILMCLQGKHFLLVTLCLHPNTSPTTNTTSSNVHTEHLQNNYVDFVSNQFARMQRS